MADVGMWALNIYVFLGLAIVLIVAGGLLLAAWIGLRSLLWCRAQKRSQQACIARTRRADGQHYPPVIGGLCEQCGRVSRTIYHPQVGPKLCSACYERYWRVESSFEQADTPASESDLANRPVMHHR